MRASPIRTRIQATGIRRLGRTPRFRYRRADGRAASARELARIRTLVIPPAWRDVVVARAAQDKVQAIGRDQAGRWQYRYRPSYTAHRARRKFDRLYAFGSALPALRRTLHQDLARPDLPLEKALAASVLLLAACAIRPGAAEYARDNGTYGLATLRSQHVEITGTRIRLRFRGKHGVEQRHEIRSRTLALLLGTMKALPGRELFKYRDERGRLRDIRRRHVNAYLKSAMGEEFSARDFRTWSGTLLCAAALRARNAPDAERRRAVLEALDDTAARLGNTRAVVRESYVHPAVLAAFRRGQVVSHAIARLDGHVDRGGVALGRHERALLSLLRPPARAARIRNGSRAAVRTAAAPGPA